MTLSVLDAAGNPQTIQRPSTPGRAGENASRPVVLSTQDLAAITALATAAGQLLTNETLADMLLRLQELVSADVSGVQTVTLESILTALQGGINVAFATPQEITGTVDFVAAGNVPVVSAGTFPVVDGSTDYVWLDRSITSNGSSQQVMAANANRQALYIENPSDRNQYFRFLSGTASIGGAGCILLVPGDFRFYEGPACPKGQVQAICGENGRVLTAYEA